MTGGRALRLAALAALATAGAARAAGGLHGDPAVVVVDAAAGSPGTGTVTLGNDGTATAVAARITAAPGCGAAVQVSPLTGFSLAPGASRLLDVACAAAPPGMQRCLYQVRNASDAVMTEFEAVCASAGATGLAADPATIDFGSVVVGGAAPRPIQLSNTGAASLDRLFIETTDLAGNFSVAAPCNPDARACDAGIAALAAGATTTMIVGCTPRSPGPHTAALHVVSSAGTALAAPIALSCTGVAATAPVLSVTPGAIDVGRVEVVNATATTTVHLGNAGAGTLRVTAIQVLDGGTGAAADWTVTPRAPCSAAIPPVCLLAAGHTADLDLVFDPASPGVRDAILLLGYRDTSDRSVAIPLHGIGDGPTLELVGAPAVLEFGALRPGEAGALTLTVTNRGTRDLDDATLAITPAGPPFTASPGASLAIAAGATAPVTVTCAPAGTGRTTARLRLSAPDILAAPAELALRCTGDPAQPLSATPPAVLLGEVRISDSATAAIAITSPVAPVALTLAELATPIAGLTVVGAPATTPASLELTAAPAADGSLDDRITVAPASGTPLEIAVTGSAVTAAYGVPPAASLGTFCVDRPTTPRILALSATGTATIQVSAPALSRADSPFDLARVAPLVYPTTLAPSTRAVIAVTPRRQDTAGTTSDTVTWTTDVPGAVTARTAVTASFIADGGAIAPEEINFGGAQIHVDVHNARQVTLQNCSSSAIQLDAPAVPAPFSIDSPSFPPLLGPGETAAFSVGFHPTLAIPVTKILTITSPQLATPLIVELSGEGTASDSGSDAGNDAGTPSTSFYACGGCTAGDPSGAIACALAVLGTLVPRRRRAA